MLFCGIMSSSKKQQAQDTRRIRLIIDIKVIFKTKCLTKEMKTKERMAVSLLKTLSSIFNTEWQL